MKIDPKVSDAMNRFYRMSRSDALEVVDGLLRGETYPEVTYWRLRSYVEMAERMGWLVGNGTIRVPKGHPLHEADDPEQRSHERETFGGPLR